MIGPIRLDKISVALYGLRSRYIIFYLVARISINLTTIITSSYYNKDLIVNKKKSKYLFDKKKLI